MGKWGRRWCEEKFDNRLVAKDIFNLYQEVLSEKEVKIQIKKICLIR
ncbi:hypothetical protein JTS93_19395 [Clostridium botulinum]|nr:hypothetical protein [Clostridium botulinum]